MLPRLLVARVHLAALVGTTVVLVTFVLLAVQRFEAVANRSLVEANESLAQTIVRELAPSSRKEPMGAAEVEPVLRRYDVLPGVGNLSLVDSDGRIVGQASFYGTAPLERDRRLALPRGLRTESRVDRPSLFSALVGTPGAARLVTWVPIRSTAHSGWVRVERNISTFLAAARIGMWQVLAGALPALAVVSGLTWLALGAYRRGLVRLERYVAAIEQRPIGGKRPSLAPPSVRGFEEARALVSRLRRLSEAVSVLERGSVPAIGVRHALFEHSFDAVLILDRDGVVREFNPAARALFGLGELTGIRAESLLAPGWRQEYRRAMARFWATGEVPGDGEPTRVHASGANGRVFEAELVATRVGDAGMSTIVAIIRRCGPSVTKAPEGDQA
ncbi:MAG: PAS domain S-box protein [Burkholderiaceae bacterium]